MNSYRSRSRPARSRLRPNVLELEGRRLLSADVLTFHNDNSRDGANLNETTLTPANVNVSSFGKVGFLGTDGKVDAEPLTQSNLKIPGAGTHNVVYVATENDSIYAFDAQSGAILWHDGPSGTPTTTLPAGDSPLLASDMKGSTYGAELGILDTPVIDSATNTIYAVATSRSLINGNLQVHQEIIALDTTTGALKARHMIDNSITYPGSGATTNGSAVVFHPELQKERVSLTEVNGVIYTGWTALVFGPPYTGWLIGFNASDLSLTSVLNINPNGLPVSNSPDGSSGSDFWNSGGGFGVDSQGNLYDTTSNGPFDAAVGDYGDTFLKVSTANNTTKVTDYFTPFDQQLLADKDLDVGSSGVLILPDMTNAAGQTVQLAISGSKIGSIYIVNRNGLGGYSTAGNYNYEYLPNVLGAAEADSPAYYNGSVYFGALGQPLRAYTFNNAVLPSTASSQSSIIYSYPGTSPSISANGNTNGIVWALDNDNAQSVLHAYDASNLGNELYNSNQSSTGRDVLGPDSKFLTPMIANGKVYVPTENGVAVFGLLPPTVLAGAFSSPNPAAGGSLLLGAVGADSARSESSLSYSWTTIATPPGAPSPVFSANGTNASKLVAVGGTVAGSYTFQVTITDPDGQAVSSDVTVKVGLPVPTVAVPAFSSANPVVGGLNLLGAVGGDSALGESALSYSWTTLATPAGAPAPSFSVNGTNASKLVAVGIAEAGSYTFRVTISDPVGQVTTSDLTVNVALPAPTIEAPAFSSPISLVGGLNLLGAIGADAALGESALKYTWATIAAPAGAPLPSFSGNGTNASKLVAVGIAEAGFYTFRVTISDPVGQVTTSDLTVAALLPSPTILVPAFSSPAPVVGKTAFLGVVAEDQGFPAANLTYTWAVLSVPPGAPLPKISPNQTSRSSLVSVTFAKPGTYSLRVAVENPFYQVAISDVSLIVGS